MLNVVSGTAMQGVGGAVGGMVAMELGTRLKNKIKKEWKKYWDGFDENQQWQIISIQDVYSRVLKSHEYAYLRPIFDYNSIADKVSLSESVDDKLGVIPEVPLILQTNNDNTFPLVYEEFSASTISTDYVLRLHNGNPIIIETLADIIEIACSFDRYGELKKDKLYTPPHLVMDEIKNWAIAISHHTRNYILQHNLIDIRINYLNQLPTILQKKGQTFDKMKGMAKSFMAIVKSSLKISEEHIIKIDSQAASQKIVEITKLLGQLQSKLLEQQKQLKFQEAVNQFNDIASQMIKFRKYHCNLFYSIFSGISLPAFNHNEIIDFQERLNNNTPITINIMDTDKNLEQAKVEYTDLYKAIRPTLSFQAIEAVICEEKQLNEIQQEVQKQINSNGFADLSIANYKEIEIISKYTEASQKIMALALNSRKALLDKKVKKAQDRINSLRDQLTSLKSDDNKEETKASDLHLKITNYSNEITKLKTQYNEEMQKLFPNQAELKKYENITISQGSETGFAPFMEANMYAIKRWLDTLRHIIEFRSFSNFVASAANVANMKGLEGIYGKFGYVTSIILKEFKASFEFYRESLEEILQIRQSVQNMLPSIQDENIRSKHKRWSENGKFIFTTQEALKQIVNQIIHDIGTVLNTIEICTAENLKEESNQALLNFVYLADICSRGKVLKHLENAQIDLNTKTVRAIPANRNSYYKTLEEPKTKIIPDDHELKDNIIASNSNPSPISNLKTQTEQFNNSPIELPYSPTNVHQRAFFESMEFIMDNKGNYSLPNYLLPYIYSGLKGMQFSSHGIESLGNDKHIDIILNIENEKYWPKAFQKFCYVSPLEREKNTKPFLYEALIASQRAGSGWVTGNLLQEYLQKFRTVLDDTGRKKCYAIIKSIHAKLHETNIGLLNKYTSQEIYEKLSQQDKDEINNAISRCYGKLQLEDREFLNDFITKIIRQSKIDELKQGIKEHRDKTPLSVLSKNPFIEESQQTFIEFAMDKCAEKGMSLFTHLPIHLFLLKLSQDDRTQFINELKQKDRGLAYIITINLKLVDHNRTYLESIHNQLVNYLINNKPIFNTQINDEFYRALTSFDNKDLIAKVNKLAGDYLEQDKYKQLLEIPSSMEKNHGFIGIEWYNQMNKDNTILLEVMAKKPAKLIELEHNYQEVDQKVQQMKLEDQKQTKINKGLEEEKSNLKKHDKLIEQFHQEMMVISKKIQVEGKTEKNMYELQTLKEKYTKLLNPPSAPLSFQKLPKEEMGIKTPEEQKDKDMNDLKIKQANPPKDTSKDPNNNATRDVQGHKKLTPIPS